MKKPLEQYRPPKPLKTAPAKIDDYPKAWVVFNYTLIPAYVGVVMAIFFTVLKFNELPASFASFLLFPIVAMLIYGIPALLTGIFVAALHLKRHLTDTLKAAAIGFIGGALPPLFLDKHAVSAMLMFGLIASVSAFLMAWRILPKTETANSENETSVL